MTEIHLRDFSVVQGLGLRAFTAVGMGSIASWENRILQAMRLGKKIYSGLKLLGT